jgi:hypothetical protein
MRGGGVGFYVREGLTFKLLDTLSPFEPKIMESIQSIEAIQFIVEL